MTEMHDVVEMILNRIKDYPEDFVSEPSQSRYNIIGDDSPPTKWSEALRTVYPVATEEEKLALDEATTDAKRAIYMGAALKTIMREDVVEPTPDTLKYKSTVMPVASLRNQTSQLLNDVLATEYREEIKKYATNNA